MKSVGLEDWPQKENKGMKLSRGMESIGLAVALFSVAALLALSGCGGGGGGGASSAITGLVQNAAALPMAGVTVSAGGVTGTTGADGKYTLRTAPGDVVVKAEMAGFVDVIDVATVAAGETGNVNFTMSAVGQSNALAAMLTTPTTATDTRGAEVDLPAGVVLDAAGNPVDVANVDVTTGLPTDANYAENFPGLFIGTQAGLDLPIESFGFVTVDMTSGGSKCTLGPAGADIAIPVAAGADPGTPTIELWSLDETTGKWVYEGLATRDASGAPVVYRAHVTHFSTYNLDRPIAAGMPLTVTVKDGASNVAGASVVVVSTGTGGAVWEGRAVTGANGTCSFPEIPQDGNIQVKVNYGELAGTGSSYSVDGGAATMTVTLLRLVSKVITFVRMVGAVETPVAGAAVQAFAEGGDFAHFNGTTAADGKVTLQLPSGAMMYMINANATIDAESWYGSAQADSLDALSAKITMTTGQAN